MRRPRHNHLLLVSQFALLLLIAALAWQGVSAARSHERTVRGLLGDYAALIAENAERGFNAALGYRTFYALLQAVQAQPELFPTDAEWAEDALDAAQGLPVSAAEVLLVVSRSVDGTREQVLWRGSRPDRQASWAELAARLEPAEAERGGFRVYHPAPRDRTEMVLGWSVPGVEAEILLWFDPAMLRSRIASILAEATLLPAALGDPARIRPGIRLALRDPAARLVFATSPEPGGDLARSRAVGGDYSGLLAGFEITASLDPAIAGELVIGGLPYDWLPIFLGLAAVSLLLGALTFFLTRRQREVQTLRDDFVARVSHELRTPLTQIRMYAESLLHRRIAEKAGRRDALEVINREALRLGHMVDSILRFERPADRAPAAEHRPYRLLDWGRALQAEFRPLLEAAEARIELDIPADAATRCNRDALTQVAGNLLDNALKYGPRGQTIRIGHRAAGNVWRLEFRDQGPGIPPGRRESVFDPYTRLERDRERGTTGTGIGLSVAREIARSMAGDLVYEPDGDNGRFVLRLREPPEARHDG